jgi:cell wall-associated NlpC family hydrolase
MRRILTLSVAIASATLALLPLLPAAAAGKSTAAAKKKPADDNANTSTATGADAGSEKKAAGTPLDLPLPAGGGPGAPVTTNAAGTAPDSKAASKVGADAPAKNGHGPNATVELETLGEFSAQPPRIQQLIRDAIDLTRLNLTYNPGSADPDNGGMDGPGTIYYLLHAHRFNDAVRESSGQYLWVRKNGAFFPVVNRSDESVEFNELLPGDLLFWAGAAIAGQDIPISEVMLYLGRDKESGQRIMFGASEGRSYHGVKRRGVSVFDFAMPKPDAAGVKESNADFVGFARVPGMRSGGNAAVLAVGTVASANAAKPASSPSKQSVPKKKGKSKK